MPPRRPTGLIPQPGQMQAEEKCSPGANEPRRDQRRASSGCFQNTVEWDCQAANIINKLAHVTTQ